MPVPWVAPPPHVNSLLSARIPELFLVDLDHSPTWGEALEGGLASIREAELVEAEAAARAGGGR